MSKTNAVISVHDRYHHHLKFHQNVCLSLLLLMLAACPFRMNGQNQAVADSIISIIQSTDKEERGQLYIDLSNAYGINDPSNGYLAAEQAVDVALTTEDQELLSKGYLKMGRWQRYLGGDPEKPIGLLEKALGIAEDNGFTELEFHCHSELARMYIWMQEDSLRQKHQVVCDSLIVLIDSPKLKAIMLMRSAQEDYDKHRMDSSIAKYTRSLELFKEAGSYPGVIGAKFMLARSALRLRDPDRAAVLRAEAIAIARKKDDKFLILHALLDDAYAVLFEPARFDSIEAAQILAEFETLGRNMKTKIGLIKYHLFQANKLEHDGDMHGSLVHLRELKKLCQHMHENRGVLQASSGIYQNLVQQGQLEEALEEVISVLDLALKINSRVVDMYSWMSDIYLRTEEPALALEYQQKSVAYGKSTSDPLPYYFYFSYYIDYANIYQALDEPDQAMTYIDSALTVARQNEKPDKVLDALVVKSRLLFEQGNLADAQQNFKEAMSIANQKDVSIPMEIMLDAQHFGAQFYYSQGEYGKSIRHGEKAISLTESAQTSESSLKNHEVLWKSYDALNRPEKALLHLRQYHTIKDSLFSIEKTATLLQLRESYESEQKQLQIELLERDQDLQELALSSKDQSLQRSQFQSLGILVLALILALVGWLLFNRYKLRVKADELRMQNESYRLEQERAAATQQLEMAEMRSSFLANVSHEIRTPLTLIKGPLEQWKDDQKSVNLGTINQMDSNVNRLVKLVDEAMQVVRSKDEPLPLKPEQVNAASFFERQLQNFSAIAKAQNVLLVLEDHTDQVTVALDKYRMERVMMNFMSNALRYTSAGGSIRLTLTRTEKSLYLKLKDSGRGIQAQHIPHLFNRFYRADSEETGYGLGLAIVKDAVEHHGGTVSVESTLGEGTCFTVVLPLDQADAKILHHGIDSAETLTPALLSDEAAEDNAEQELPRVLVVEDNPELQQYLVEILSPDHQVVCAANGAEGEEMALSIQPDMIISDIMMPVKDGLEMLATLKNNLITSHIPVVMLTAKATHEDRLKGLEIGADHYLSKPFSPKELRLCLRNMNAQRKRMHERLGNGGQQGEAEGNGLTRLDSDFLVRARSVVENHIDDPELTIEQFCREVALNRSSVHVKLKALTGSNTSGFIRNIRIRKAVQLIENDSYSLAEVADLTGFNNRQSFNRAFKEYTGTTPTGFRDRMKTVRPDALVKPS